MATIAMIGEDEATRKVNNIFEEIKSYLGLDFVSNMYNAMAHKHGYLKSTWEMTNAITQKPGKLNKLTKEIVAVKVCAIMVGDY